MGLEEHLLTMFRDDFEFSDANGASHHGAVGHAPQAPAAATATATATEALIETDTMVLEPAESGNIWTAEAEKELRKIPFFVRGKARKNTERFAVEQGLVSISLDTLYDAKAHYAR
jgi:light-independent protochlorophyllide reductase subunit B